MYNPGHARLKEPPIRFRPFAQPPLRIGLLAVDTIGPNIAPPSLDQP
jgi:hypothetical protein